MLPTFGQGAAQAMEDGAALSSRFKLHGNDVYSFAAALRKSASLSRDPFPIRLEIFVQHLEPKDSPQRRQILKALNERDYPVFGHEQRAGGDDSWIYAFDARSIGDKLPQKKLGPWDFRSRTAAIAARREVMGNLWEPPVSLKGDRKITRVEAAEHGSFDDCSVIIRGKVYDISEWKDHHPGGPFVARMHAGKDATGEFGDYHSKMAERHIKYFCVGTLVD